MIRSLYSVAKKFSLQNGTKLLSHHSWTIKRFRRTVAIVGGTLALTLATAGTAAAQITIDITSPIDFATAIQTVNSNPGNSYSLNFLNGFTMNHQTANFANTSTVTLIGSGTGQTIDGANLYQPLIINSGTVTLQGLNTVNALAPVTINGGTLMDTTSSLQGAVKNDSNVVFYQTLVGTYAGNMTGTGAVEINSGSIGGGVETFGGTNTYSGGTTVDAGATLVGTTSSLQGNITNNWLLKFNQATTGTYAGVLSGSGGVEFAGGGTVMFTGLNTFTGGIKVDASTKLVGTTDTLQGTMINNGAVYFNQNLNGSPTITTYSGDISGSGSVEINNGLLTLSGTNTYSGGTTIDSLGTLVGTTVSVQGDVVNNGFLQLNQSSAGSYAGQLSGAGTVEISGTGPITFSGTNTYNGGTIVDHGSTLIGTTSSVQGLIQDLGAVVFNQSTAGTYAGGLIGAGSVEIKGVGSVTFGGINTYTGGTTVDTGASLIGTTDSLQGNITNNGSLQFDQSWGGTYAGNLSGTGRVEIANGIVGFSGSNNYSGGTTVDVGATLFGNTTSLEGTFINNGLVQFGQSTAGTYAGNMSGSGSVEIAGGPITFSGTNTYSGGTQVDANSVLIGTTSSVQGAITNNGGVQFSQATAGTYGGNMSGTGAVEISGTGPITFTGLNTYGGGTIVDNGSTLIGNTNSVQGTITNQGAIQFNQSSAGTYSGNMTGAGSVEISGPGSVSFTGTNTYSGGTKVDSGSLLIGSTTGIQGAVVNNGNVQFNQTTSGTYAGNMSGLGSLEIGGLGPITLTGTNTYAGGTTVDVGSSLIGTSTSLQGNILNNGSLLFNQATNGTYSGVISGSGGVEFSGQGWVTLTGANTYTGGTTVDSTTALIGTTTSLQGPMVVNGTLAINQSNSGTLTGNISGSGLLEVVGGGIVTLSGINTYSGGTIVGMGGAVSGTTTSLQGNIDNLGGVQFSQSVAGTYSGIISNGGIVDISGTGPITFTGANTYSGGTNIEVGATLIGTTTSLQGKVSDNGTMKFIQSSNGTYAGLTQGSGAVEVGGGGTVTFQGNNTYTGGTTVDLGTTLSGSTTSLQGNFVNNGAVQFNQSVAGIFGGNMSGTGVVEISGGATVSFAGANTYTGGTTIDSGSSLIGSTSALTGNILDNGSLQIRQVNPGTFAGNISGTGALDISGIVTLTGINTYTGGTTVDSGDRLIGNIASVQGNIANNGTVQFSPVSNATNQVGVNQYSGNMSGTGSVEITAGAPMIFSGNNSYTGGTKIDTGATLWGTANGIQGNITNSGSLLFTNSTNPAQGNPVLPNGTGSVASLVVPASPNWTGLYTGNISGSGSVEIGNGGMVAMAGTNSYTGGTLVDSGSTLIGTTGSLQGSITDNGFVQFLQGIAGSYAGNLTGTGGVEISGGGPVTFSGNNTYSGGTTVDNGSTLIGTTSSLQGQIVDNGLVKFSQSTMGNFAGVISGTGGVEIGGTGLINFTGHNTYTGGTTIDNGSSLNVSGSIFGNVTVNSGGMLTGTGSIGNLTINAGGTFNPGQASQLVSNNVGSPIPPMIVNGNFTQSTGSTYTVTMTPTTNSMIQATGTATIQNGTTLKLAPQAGTYIVGSTYNILSATGGLTGKYSSVLTGTLNQNVLFTEQYSANNLKLNVNSNLAPQAQTSNQSAVASVLDQTSGTATGGYATAITQLTTLGSGQLSGALNQLSGDLYPSLSTIQRQTSTTQLQLISNRLAGLTGPGIPTVASLTRPGNIRLVSSQSEDSKSKSDSEPSLTSDSLSWTSWAQGYGLGGGISGDGNAGGTNYRLGGTLFGVERWLDDTMMFGVLGGYANTSVANRLDSATANVNSYQGGLYEMYRQDSWYVSNVDVYTNNSNSISRPIAFGNIYETASGKGTGNQWGHYTELGTTYTIDDIRIQPFTGLQYTYLDQGGYTESGAGALDLTVGSQTVNSVRNGIGARLIGETSLWGVLVMPTASIRYQHEWGNGTQLVTSSMAGAPTAQFVTNGNHTGRDFGLFSLGATAYFTENMSVYGFVDTQAATSFVAVTGSGGVQYSW